MYGGGRPFQDDRGISQHDQNQAYSVFYDDHDASVNGTGMEGGNVDEAGRMMGAMNI